MCSFPLDARSCVEAIVSKLSCGESMTRAYALPFHSKFCFVPTKSSFCFDDAHRLSTLQHFPVISFNSLLPFQMSKTLLMSSIMTCQMELKITFIELAELVALVALVLPILILRQIKAVR